MTKPTYVLVQVKSYGDLTIAVSALRRVPCHDRERFGLLISPHLSELVAVLAPVCRVETVPLAERVKPAFFDPHRRHLIDRLRSAVSLRRAIAEAAAGATLVMPHLAWKNRFVTGRRAAVALPVADNIYAAYEAFIRGISGELAQVASLPSQRLRRIGICPTSSSTFKNLPREVIGLVADACARSGHEPELLILEGETHERIDSIPTRIVTRSFAALHDALATYGAVISADSLPAHLSEFCGTPVFVCSPVSNQYWLPPGAFRNRSWGIFDAGEELTNALRQFLQRHVMG